jgi:predicted Zn-dependent protease
MSTHEKTTVKVLRDGKNMELPVQTVMRCAFDAMLSPTDIINAFADGKHITITKGMMRFTQDDTELELVIAHELAHDAMKHMDKKLGNRILGAIVDGLLASRGIQTGGAFGNASAGSYSQEFESEADYVGLYMMARAGGNIEEAPKFWRRMAAENPGSISERNSSHPTTPYRFTALEKTVLEIREKQKAGVPVLPEMKDGKPYMEAVVKGDAPP